VIAITGPRQSGKTTLIKNIFPDYHYFNLENPVERNFALEDPQSFLAQSKRIIIDEVQRVPEIFSYIQVMVDDNPDIKVVLSGSQNFEFNEKITQTLAGRVAKFVLLPFSLQELENTAYWIEDYRKYLISGFYPRIYDHQLNPADWYPNYVETYVERDVTSLLNVANKDRFIHFVTSCAANVGNVINYTLDESDLAWSVFHIERLLKDLIARFGAGKVSLGSIAIAGRGMAIPPAPVTRSQKP
jgi:predicted AAA+ superfamily ATPase